jgi:hypothetical protein
MLRITWGVLLFASPALAQDSAANPLAAAGCGPNEIQFDVKTDKKQHPTSQPEAGKALVYVIGAAWSDTVALHIGTPPTRFGIDGARLTTPRELGIPGKFAMAFRRVFPSFDLSFLIATAKQ